MPNLPSKLLPLGLLVAGLATAAPATASTAGGGQEKYPVQKDDPDVANEFAKANPGYKKRAGEHYEKEYLEDAVEQLGQAAGLAPGERTAAKKILRVFIYDWLDSLVRGNGVIQPEHLEKHLKLMDERFKGELEAGKHPKYLRWRNDRTGTRNPLAFLMYPAPGEAGKPAGPALPGDPPAGGARNLTLPGFKVASAGGGAWPVRAVLSVEASKFDEVNARQDEIKAIISDRLAGLQKSDIETPEKRKRIEADLAAAVNALFKAKPVQLLILSLDLKYI